MKNKAKEFVIFLVQWILSNIIILSISIYVVACIVLKNDIKLPILLLFLLIGCLIHVIYRDWTKRGLGFDNIECNQDYSSKRFFNWENLHWIPVIGFLGLTFWATLQGLDLLFVGPKTPFLCFFTSFIVIALFFLLIMISRGKNIVAYSIFYILFDLATAFMFNFIHFYDNISNTQNMDRDVRACEMYIKNRKTTLANIQESVNGDIQALSVLIDMNKNSISTNERTATEKYKEASEEDNTDASIFKRNNANNYSKRARNLIDTVNVQMERLNNLKTVDTNVKTMVETQSQVEYLCAKYQKEKEKFSVEDLTDLRNKVIAIDEQVAHLNRQKICIEKKYVFEDSSRNIQYALWRLKKTRDDRFASINKLIDAIFSPSKNNVSESDAADNPFIADDRQFEKRLIYLSVCLSATIDILPLLLGIFVVCSKKRKRTT